MIALYTPLKNNDSSVHTTQERVDDIFSFSFEYLLTQAIKMQMTLAHDSKDEKYRSNACLRKHVFPPYIMITKHKPNNHGHCPTCFVTATVEHSAAWLHMYQSAALANRLDDENVKIGNLPHRIQTTQMPFRHYYRRATAPSVVMVMQQLNTLASQHS